MVTAEVTERQAHPRRDKARYAAKRRRARDRFPAWLAMDENRYFAMRKHLDGLAAEQQRRDAVAPMRSHDDKVAAFRSRGIDDRLVGTIILDLQGVARDAGGLRRVRGDAQRFVSLGRYARLVLGGRVFHSCFGGNDTILRAIRACDCEDRNPGSDRFGQGDAVLDGFSGKLRTIGWDEDLTVHCSLFARSCCETIEADLDLKMKRMGRPASVFRTQL